MPSAAGTPPAAEPPFRFGVGETPGGAFDPGDPTDVPGGALALLERIAEGVDRLVALTERRGEQGLGGPSAFEDAGAGSSRWFDLFDNAPAEASHSFDPDDAWKPGRGAGWRKGEDPAG
jgi:hypothetical protein